ncbi:19940_t:CDS:2, partial [Funneliformis geosporum]
CCEKRKSENCKGRAIIKFSNSSHYLQKLVDHNHSSQATDEVATHMPTQNAFRVRIKHVRKAEMLPESQSLDGIDIQDSL